MNEKLRKILEARGLPKDATEAQAWDFLETLETKAEAAPAATRSEPTKPAAIDGDALVVAERERMIEIQALCKRFDCETLADNFIKDGAKLDLVRMQILDHVAAKKKQTSEPGFRAEVGVDERDKFRGAATDALLIRGGAVIEKATPGATDLTGHTLRELARHSLVLANQNSGGQAMDMIGRAMVVGDFANILADVANKSLFTGFDTAEETWPIWADTGNASDFKTHNIVSASEADDLDEVDTDGGEFKYGNRSDAKESYALATYGKLFAITREVIINDDLGALTNIPRSHGEAAARKVGDVAYAVLTANSAMADGVALFHSTHANLGSAAVVSETTISEAIKLAKLQKDLLAKRRLNIRLQYFVAPATIEGAAEVFFNSGQFAGANLATTRTNPYAGSRFTRVYDARLDDVSATAYYMLGAKGKTVTVFFLNGVKTPFLETKTGWTRDGVEYKVRIDAAAKALSHKAMVKNAGA